MYRVGQEMVRLDGGALWGECSHSWLSMVQPSSETV